MGDAGAFHFFPPAPAVASSLAEVFLGHAEELELPVLDLLPYFRAAQSCTYARDDGMWNDQGNQVAGEAIGGWLQARFGATILAQTRRGGN